MPCDSLRDEREELRSLSRRSSVLHPAQRHEQVRLSRGWCEAARGGQRGHSVDEGVEHGRHAEERPRARYRQDAQGERGVPDPALGVERDTDRRHCQVFGEEAQGHSIGRRRVGAPPHGGVGRRLCTARGAARFGAWLAAAPVERRRKEAVQEREVGRDGALIQRLELPREHAIDARQCQTAVPARPHRPRSGRRWLPCGG